MCKIKRYILVQTDFDPCVYLNKPLFDWGVDRVRKKRNTQTEDSFEVTSIEYFKIHTYLSSTDLNAIKAYL